MYPSFDLQVGRVARAAVVDHPRVEARLLHQPPIEPTGTKSSLSGLWFLLALVEIRCRVVQIPEIQKAGLIR